MHHSSMPFPQLNSSLSKYQNPHEADSMMKIQKDLDETKIILVRRRAVVSGPRDSLAAQDDGERAEPGRAHRRPGVQV